MRLICVDEQIFSKIREKNGVLVDKTKIMYELFKNAGFFFISRPRRFGKSLLCSTAAALFAGKKDLFKDLWIEKSDWVWDEYPVVSLDMTKASSSAGSIERVRDGIMRMLRNEAEVYGLDPILETSSNNYLGELIRRISIKTGKQIVVIVDEYDKPLLDVITHHHVHEAIHQELRDFYAQLKASSEYLRFVLLTGVFKFTQTSIFSGLNNLRDLTFDPLAAGLLGYTKQEIKEHFPEHLVALGKKLSKTQDELFEELQEQYNGYTFAVDTDTQVLSESVYNPFAINNVLFRQELVEQWFASGTPTVLIEMLKKLNFRNLDQSYLVTSFRTLQTSCDPEQVTVLTLLYYAGYLTLKAYDRSIKTVALDLPNAEVAQSLSELLLPLVTEKEISGILRLGRRLKQILLGLEHDQIVDLLNQALAQLPYFMFGTQESYYQTVFYLLLSAGNCVALTEDMMNRGRADITVILPEVVYIFELKMNQPAAVALEQIKQRGYAEKYKHLGRQIYLVGVELSSGDRVVRDILVEKLM